MRKIGFLVFGTKLFKAYKSFITMERNWISRLAYCGLSQVRCHEVARHEVALHGRYCNLRDGAWDSPLSLSPRMDIAGGHSFLCEWTRLLP